MPDEIRSIGILKPAAIGDTTLLSAVIQDLRSAYQNANIVMFVGSNNFDIARLLSGPSEVVRLHFTNVVAAVKFVRQRHFDLFLDFGPWHRINAVITHFADASYKIGFKTAGQYQHYTYHLSVVHSDTQHELENLRDLIRAIPVCASHAPSFPDLVGYERPPQQFCPSGDYAVLHLHAGGYRSHMKEWPVERWLQLAQSLSEEGLSIALTGAPSQADKNEAVIVQARASFGAKNWTNCAGATIEQTIAILRRSRLTVSVDTGVMHLAAAVGVPVLGLHGPTSPRRWGAIGKQAFALQSPAAGCGYLSLGVEYPRHCDCMRAIPVELVLAKCKEILASTSKSVMLE
jgi:heptosyltransferase I